MPPKKRPTPKVNYDNFLEPYLKSKDKPDKILSMLNAAGVDIKNNQIIEQFAKHKNPKLRVLGAQMALHKGDIRIIGRLAGYKDRVVLKDINTFLSNVLKSAAESINSGFNPIGIISIVFMRYKPTLKEAMILSKSKNWRVRTVSMVMKNLPLSRIKEIHKQDKNRTVKLFAKLVIDQRTSNF